MAHLTILLVDDDPLMHRMLVPRLRELGVLPPVGDVFTALSPDVALARLREVDADTPLAVLSDFNLKAPMNGLQLLAEVRELRPDAVRILFSGYSREQLGEPASGPEVEAFVEKPMVIDDMLPPIRDAIQRRIAASS